MLGASAGLVSATGQPLGGHRVQTKDGVRVIPRLGRSGLPECPHDIQDAVEMYARNHGRTAKVHFAPVAGWFVRFEARSNDLRMKAYQEGRCEKPPSEDVFFRLPKPGGRPGDTIPMDILQWGPSGVVNFLERGNTWSGRGEYASVEEAARKAHEHNEAMRIRHREQQKVENRLEQREKRRHLLGIPFIPVGIDLRKRKGAE